MGMFRYKGQDASGLVLDAIDLVQYSYHGLEEAFRTSYEANGFNLETLWEGLFGTSTTEGIINGSGDPDSEQRARDVIESKGWTVLTASDLNYSGAIVDQYGTFQGETTEFQDASADVTAKYDANGNLTEIAVVFRGTSGAREDALTDTVGDVFDYAEFLKKNPNYTFDAFYNLLSSVKKLAQDNGLSADDILISGHSLGGGAVVNMAENSDDYFGGFFVDANYIAAASFYVAEDGSKILDNGAEVFSIDIENDPVPSVIDGDTFHFFGNDDPYQYRTDNIVVFNDLYDQPAFWGGGDWVNPLTWTAHLPATYEIAVERIASSFFYDDMKRDSLVVISDLSDARRESTWVRDIELPLDNTEHYGKAAFILGSDGNDKLKGGAKADKLDGFDGNDTLKGMGGSDTLYDGAGVDSLYGGSGQDTFIMAADGDKDYILDFKQGTDVIDLSEWGVTNFSQLHVEQLYTWFVPSHVLISYGDEQLEVSNGFDLQTTNLFDASDFIFA